MWAVGIESYKSGSHQLRSGVHQIKRHDLDEFVTSVGVTRSGSIGGVDHIEFGLLDRVHFIKFDFSGGLTDFIDGDSPATVGDVTLSVTDVVDGHFGLVVVGVSPPFTSLL